MSRFILILFLGLLSMAAVKVKDVETLLDDREKYQDEEVTVVGKVKEVIGPKVVVLESGGFLNNEIEVTGEERLPAAALKKGAKLEVTGTVTTVPRVRAGRAPAPVGRTRIEREVAGRNTMIMVEKVKVL
ncbi:MAG: hypothetical protein ACLGHN_10655 [Bacteriovoracia bacterium]